MRNSLPIAMLLACASISAAAAPFTKADRAQVARIHAQFTAGWRHSSRSEVMNLFAPEAVFIPHDGVKPHIGKAAIEQFWFPKAGTAGTVTDFVMTAEGVSGDNDHAIVWGKSDLHWQNNTTAFHWPGYYLMSVQRKRGKWLVTHLMSSDEQPTSKPLKTP